MPLGGKKGRKGPALQLAPVEEDESLAMSMMPMKNGAGLTLGNNAVAISTSGIAGLASILETDIVDVNEGEPAPSLGRGAAGWVELKRWSKTGDLVAVKHMSMAEKRDRDQALKEIDAIRNLEHPAIVHYHGGYYDSSSQTVCFVLDFMNCGSLADLLTAGGPMSEPMVGSITRGILDGIGHMHEMKMVHRDLKPGNVLAHYDEETHDVSVKIADFGIMRSLAEGEMAGTGTGTFHYCPDSLGALTRP
jgi:tRNA A-37 threonylcarbamoyl transferase component Bud32